MTNPNYENDFVKEVHDYNITDPLEILNWYRNLYYKEDANTERGLMATTINNLFMSMIAEQETEWIESVCGFIAVCEDNYYCSNCGNKVRFCTKYCSRCGKLMKENENFYWR